MSQEVDSKVASAYDAEVASAYDQSVNLPYRRDLEEHSVAGALGSLKGQSVLDLACGTGHYSRLVRSKGAAPVVGVDVSPQMVDVARELERERLSGIKYIVGDVADLEEGQFDHAIGVYLLHYATSAEHLGAMCRGIARNLRPGGRFLGWQVMETLSRDPRYYEIYSIYFTGTENLADGDEYLLQVRSDGLISSIIPLYCWSVSAYENALRTAGFETVRWTSPIVAPTADGEFWERMHAAPLFGIVEAIKG